jgi:hypothetical protein
MTMTYHGMAWKVMEMEWQWHNNARDGNDMDWFGNGMERHQNGMEMTRHDMSWKSMSMAWNGKGWK